jgi:S-DNA-T family DNA segregation ATPase FtsK/SpoIIIE
MSETRFGTNPKDKKPAAKPGTPKTPAPRSIPKVDPRAAARPDPRPPVKARPGTTPKTTSQTPVRLVKRTQTVTTTKGSHEQPVAPFRINLDPDQVGRALNERPGWVDESIAILLMVFGMVSLLALLNTSPTAALSNMWSDTLRQFFGYLGALLFSLMIVGAGALIVLPRIGVRIQMPWQRILMIEIAYLAFLAVLHLLPHDPEPRALARSGQGGGYVGWALSDLVFKLFGSGVAIVFFVTLAVVALCMVFGIRRVHIRQGLNSTSKRLAALAEQMKREPLPRPRLTPASRPMAVRTQAATPPSALAEANSPAASRAKDTISRKSTPMARPLRHDPASAEPAMPPAPPPASPPAPSPAPGASPAASADWPAIPLTVPAESESEPELPHSLSEPVEPPAPKGARSKPPSKPSKPAPAVPERRTRYFTVEDFKEVRQPIPRAGGLPPLSLLSDTELNKPTEQEVNNNVRIIENTLLEFDIDVEVVDVSVGPTVTQYAVQPFREVTTDQGEVVMQRVRVNKIASLSNDLALALSAKRLRIQPYVPGQRYMGIEVPNQKPSTVALRPVMESEAFAKAFIKRDPDHPGQTYAVPLVVPLGRDVSGSAFVVDLAAMPHLLIAGTTGSGKSVCITALAVALVMNNLPSRLRLVMLDPKMVELSRFNGLPHLLGAVETDMERIIGVLRWATREMDRRYKLLEAEAARNIEAYNKALGKARESEWLPYIVLMIDEIGDLMLSRPDEMERTLTRLAQMARAVGIHLVVATQRPSVDIITGLIKANFPARISFAVASGVDSRVILDTTGAESLMGRGDMLYLAPDASGPQRLQGCFVSDTEIDQVVAYWKDWQRRQPALAEPASAPWEIGMTRRESLNDVDPMLEDAIDMVVREGEASASLIQRRLGIGYPRAAQLLDMLVELGVAGSLKEGGRAREVLMKPGTDPYKKLMDRRKK